jgi:hypothetical protein
LSVGGGVVTSSDTVSYEQMIFLPHPVHRWMMFNGIFHNEVFNLEKLAKNGFYEGVNITLSLTIKATTGSMINPIFIN